MNVHSVPLAAEAIRARRERRRTWYGYIAGDNIDHVADRIRTLLTGHRYTFVANNADMPHSLPEVRTGQRLQLHKPWTVNDAGPVRVWHDEDTHGISVADSYGVWGISTTHATEADAREDAEHEKHKRRCTYVRIEGGVGEDPTGHGKIEVTQYNYVSPPERLHWVIAVEPSDADLEMGT